MIGSDTKGEDVIGASTSDSDDDEEDTSSSFM
jgi:hypothetical protein